MTVTINDSHTTVYNAAVADRPLPAYAASLPFLLSQVGARTAQLFADRLAALGVTPRAYGVMSNLAVAEGQTQQQLADALGIHRNNMVGLIDSMEGSGWVRRHRNVRDRRAFDVRLTDAGADVVRRVDALMPVLDEAVGGTLSEAERRTLCILLARLADALGLSPGVHPHLAAAPRSGGGGPH